MTTTLLPSFQSFLETTAQGQRPVSPLALQQQQQQQQLQYQQQQQQQLFPSPANGAFDLSPMGFAHWQPPSFGATSSEDEEEDDELQPQDQLLLLRHRSASSPIARRYAAVAAASTGVHSPACKRVKKKYLKERERCEIVRRVRAGEKQAHLAKEFGVSRAAVCYLLKHQMEILSRSAERL